MRCWGETNSPSSYVWHLLISNYMASLNKQLLISLGEVLLLLFFPSAQINCILIPYTIWELVMNSHNRSTFSIVEFISTVASNKPYPIIIEVLG